METSEIKSRMGSTVIYQGKEYILSGCTLRKDKEGNLFYQAEIKDIKANSIIICKLNDIE